MDVHFLDARGALGGIRDWLRVRLEATHERASAILALKPLDVVVKVGPQVIPEKGHLGYAPEPGVIYLTVDPGNPALSANADLSLERMFAHELHHAARWDGPGYGRTLGESLVSEGLAGHFALEVFGGMAEPWERLDPTIVRAHIVAVKRDWRCADYSHGAWFFGAGEYPNWLGYSLGFRLVERYLMRHPEYRASTLAAEEAQVFFDDLDRLGAL